MKTVYVFLAAACLSVACTRQPRQITAMQSRAIAVDSTADAIQDTAYLRSLQSVQEELSGQLNIPIGYAPVPMKAFLPESPLLNWATDALYDMAVQVAGTPVDFAIVNIGGIRCDWQAGDITWRHVFELMPFDNRLVILTMKGEEVLQLCDVIARQGGQGISRTLRMVIDGDEAKQVRLNGKPIEEEAVYYVATSDYLSNGMDNLTPLAHHLEKRDTDLKIRDLYIEYVHQTTGSGKPVTASTDGRIQIRK